MFVNEESFRGLKVKSFLEINTEGFRKGKKREAKKELRTLLRKVVRKQIAINVIVTKDFQATVNRCLQEKRKVTIPYDPKRSKGQAIAKTSPYISNGKLHFTLIIDGAIFGEWKVKEKISRSLTLGHEVVHIRDDILRFEEMGAEAFEEPKTLQEVMFHLAHDIWMEYHAERIILDISKKLALEMEEITFDPTLSRTRIKDLKEIVREILPFLQNEIEDFRKSHSTIDDLWGTAYLRIREMLFFATYVAAISDTKKRFQRRDQ